MNDSETQERWLKGVEIKNILVGCIPPDLSRSLRPRRSFRKLISIYPQARSAPDSKCKKRHGWTKLKKFQMEYK